MRSRKNTSKYKMVIPLIRSHGSYKLSQFMTTLVVYNKDRAYYRACKSDGMYPTKEHAIAGLFWIGCHNCDYAILLTLKNKKK